jgi:hypothetical protein
MNLQPVQLRLDTEEVRRVLQIALDGDSRQAVCRPRGPANQAAAQQLDAGATSPVERDDVLHCSLRPLVMGQFERDSWSSAAICGGENSEEMAYEDKHYRVVSRPDIWCYRRDRVEFCRNV